MTMMWHILDQDGALLARLNDFDPEKEDLTGRTVVEREVPNTEGWKWDTASADYIPDPVHARAAKHGEIEARLQDAFLTGFASSIGTLQMRDAEDRTNWLSSAHAYKAAIDAGHGAIEGATFRTAENDTITVSFDAGHQILLDLQAWGLELMQCSWRLKDQLTAAGDAIQAIQAIDVESEAWGA